MAKGGANWKFKIASILRNEINTDWPFSSSPLPSTVRVIIPIAEEAVAEAGPRPRALSHRLEHPPDDPRNPHVHTFQFQSANFRNLQVAWTLSHIHMQ